MAELQYLQSAFAADPGLCDRVLAAAQESHDRLQLFVDVARHLTHAANGQPAVNANGIGPAPVPSKKRKLESDFSFDPSSTVTVLDIPDVSFSIPVRKKLSVKLLTSQAGTAAGAGVSISGKDATYEIPWSSIAQVFCLPVPEKAARQQNFVIILEPSALCQGESQFVFTLPETPYVGSCAQASEQDTWVTLTGRMMNTLLMDQGKGITLPSEEDFHSAIPQPHRKGEVAYHVKAHLGSKDGYLFFLPSGIVFGFRKPMQVFLFHEIQSISYTSVLQRTFNLVITTQASPDDANQESKEVEFAMLDQADFAGIDQYVKSHELNDASMAKERMAQRIGVNDPKRKKGEEEADGNGEPDDIGEEEETELQRAERELQDAEDEEEEDYDPGSEGESEGEGSDSEGENDHTGRIDDIEEIEGGEE